MFAFRCLVVIASLFLLARVSSGEEPARTDRHGDPLPKGAVRRFGTVRFRHGERIDHVAFSPDGRALASAGMDYAVRLWEVHSGKPLGVLRDNNSMIAVAFAPDGKTLATGTPGGVTLWDVATRRELWKYKDGEHWPRTFAFSRDGMLLASGSYLDDRVFVWDTATGKRLHSLPKQQSSVDQVAFLEEGKILAFVAGDPLEVHFWDLAARRELRKVTRGGKGDLTVLSPDGKETATVDASFSVRLRSVADGKERVRIQGRRATKNRDLPLYAAVYSPDGKLLAAASQQADLVVWDLTTGKEIARLPYMWGHCLCFSPDSRLLVTHAITDSVDHLGPSNEVRLWNVAQGRDHLTTNDPIGSICSAVFAPDGKTISLGTADGLVHVRRLADGGPVWAPVSVKGSPVVSFSPDGTTLAVSGQAKTIRLLDAETGTTRRDWKVPKTVEALAFSPRGDLLASATWWESPVRLWDPATGRLVRTLDVERTKEEPLSIPGGAVRPVSFARDGKRLYFGLHKGLLGIGDLVVGGPGLETIPGRSETDCVRALSLSPDGELLAWVSDDGVRVRQLSSRKDVLGVHDNIGAVAFSADGRFLAVGERTGVVAGPVESGSVVVWELAARQELRRYRGHQGGVHTLAFSPDGELLLSASNDSTALVWDLAPEPSDKPDVKPPEQFWDDLAGDDTSLAYRAVRTLAKDSARSVPLLKTKLLQLEQEEKRIARLIKSLDDDSFDVREQASRELGRLGKPTQPALQKALDGPSSLEVRRRVSKLLEAQDKRAQLAPGAPDPATLQTLRAIHALERARTQEARQLLETLAKGPPEAPITKDARASLQRLANRATVEP